MKKNLNEAAAAGPARGGFDSCEICYVLEPECHEDQTCAYVAQMQSTSHTQNVASTAPLQCTLASSVFHSDLHKLSGFWHSHPACFQDLAQTAARSSERLPGRTLLHLAPLQLFAYPIYVQHNNNTKKNNNPFWRSNPMPTLKLSATIKSEMLQIQYYRWMAGHISYSSVVFGLGNSQARKQQNALWTWHYSPTQKPELIWNCAARLCLVRNLRIQRKN